MILSEEQINGRGTVLQGWDVSLSVEIRRVGQRQNAKLRGNKGKTFLPETLSPQTASSRISTCMPDHFTIIPSKE